MAVIIKDMDIPTDCSDCVFKRNYSCNDYGHFSECCLDDDCREVNLLLHDRPKWCQLKSVDGLIDMLQEQRDAAIEVNKERRSDILKGYKTGMDVAIRFIKEYCEMEGGVLWR